MQAEWYFDFISPFSYLQLRRIVALRSELEITPIPILFGAVLSHLGTVGPAEIAGKREFTYRFVQWRAERDGVALTFPPTHPFNPIAALRLAIAAGSTWPAITAIFEHLWKHGRAGDTGEALADVGRAIGIDDVASAIGSETVKATLRTNTESAIAAGVYGVPTLHIGGELFWGEDATDMVRDYLANPHRFADETYRRLASLPEGVRRKR
jgi:2-hydroxychromene-2-carboxylate isomerase